MIKIPTESERKKMPVGGYVCRIVKSESSLNRYDESCLLLYLDVAEGDYTNYFGDIYKHRLARGENKYPCIYNQGMTAFTTRRFNQLINAIESSNAGYVSTCTQGADWDETELEGLLVGVVFREKEYINSRGRKHVMLVPHVFKSVDDIRRGDFEIHARLYG